MLTKDKLLDIAARLTQLARELEAIGKPIREGGAPDISFAGSHTIGVILNFIGYASTKLIRLAEELNG